MKYNRIPGFHMTSPKFKLRIIKQSLLLCFYYSTLNLYANKFSVQKGSLFCGTGRLNFQGFRMTRHLADGQESSHVG